MPKLEVYQSLWAMEGAVGVDLDGDPESVTARILAAGFDGIGVNLARRPRAARAAAVLVERGLGWEAQAFVRTSDELARYLDEAIALGGAHHLNVQVAPGPATFDEALAAIQALLAVARGSPLPVLFETHRGRLTNDLLLTAALAQACPDLRLTGDLSHYVNAHEMALPVGAPYADAIETLLGRCEALHLRIAGPNQVQVAIDAPQHAVWRAQFEAWWSAAMTAWLARAPASGSFAVLCELGPPPYAITDGQGRELSDRWVEAQGLRDLARRLFARARAGVQSAASA
jgi:hypothetical protein